MRVGAVGAALRVEDQVSGGDEGPQEAEVRLFAVEAAIEVEDAVHPVAVAEDVEEASVSPLTSIRCRHSSLFMIYHRISFTLITSMARLQPHYKLDPTNVSRRPLQGVPGRLNPQN